MAVIPYADVLTSERLPVDAQDVVTRVKLVIVGTFGGSRDPDGLITERIIDPDPQNFDSLVLNHLPVPLVYEYEAPEHAQYGCERAFQLPDGFNPFLPADDDLIPDPVSNNMSDAENARDGDPGTFSESDGSDEAGLSYHLPASLRVAGFYARYSLVVTNGSIPRNLRRAVMVFQHQDTAVTPAVTWFQTTYRHELSTMEASASTEQLYAYGLHDARGEFVNRGLPYERATVLAVGVSSLGDADFTLRLQEYYPLVLNEELLEDVARAQVRLPAGTPRRVSVRGVIPPDREHTITGWPGGDETFPVAQQQYELGRTWIDFEQPGSPVGLAAEAIESARQTLTLFRSEIESAGYSVRMGERR